MQDAEQLRPEIDRIALLSTQDYDTEYASLYAPFDQQQYNKVIELIAQKKRFRPKAVVVIGIGGSNLGTAAVQEAVYGTLYNQQHPECAIYFVDTVDADNSDAIVHLVEQRLMRGENILLSVVSKSGVTPETVANAEIFIDLLRRYKKDTYSDYVVVTTDNSSLLWHLAKEHQFSVLEIPKNIGGRFSVFSAVGLFPLGIIGIDIDQFLTGARTIHQQCISTIVEKNCAAISATILAKQYNNGFTIHDTFLFSVALEGMGKWYRQLMGESIGKEYDRHGQRVLVGITPTVSIGSTDLHSVGQLYLGGRYDKITSFVTVAQYNAHLAVPNMPEYESLVGNIQNLPLATIMEAIIAGTQKAYIKGQRPFMSWILPEKNSYYIGQWMYAKMVEIIYLGFLLNINPFDQPNVESYKQETRKILAHE